MFFISLYTSDFYSPDNLSNPPTKRQNAQRRQPNPETDMMAFRASKQAAFRLQQLQSICHLERHTLL